MPFVLLSQPTTINDGDKSNIVRMARSAHERYGQIMTDVEELIRSHIASQKTTPPVVSKLKLLVPSVGNFFTALPLHDAFEFQDQRRCISSRRFVAPSFNDVRLILNTAQAKAHKTFEHRVSYRCSAQDRKLNSPIKIAMSM